MVPGLVFLSFPGEVHLICGKMVHFPCGFPVVPLCGPPLVPCSVWTIGESAADSWENGHFPREKWQNGAEINIFEGKVHQIRGKMVHFPDTDKRSGSSGVDNFVTR